jgi:uncharacterized membrane protein YuzA (DUF378 family)
MDVFKRLFGVVVFALMTLAYVVIGVSALDVGNLILWGFGYCTNWFTGGCVCCPWRYLRG